MNKIASRAANILQKLADNTAANQAWMASNDAIRAAEGNYRRPMESPTAWEAGQEAERTAYSFDPTKGTQPGIDTGRSKYDQKITPRSVMGNLYHGIHGTYDNMPSAARQELFSVQPAGVTPEEYEKAWNRSAIVPGDTPAARAALNAATTGERMVEGSAPGKRVEKGIENMLSIIPSSQKRMMDNPAFEAAIRGREKSHQDAVVRKANILRKLIPPSLMRAGLPKGM